MHFLFPLLLIDVATLARKIPEFDDDLLGRMVVSKKKFPFLTPKHNPDLVHIYPTDQQLDQIKKATGGSSQSALRSKRNKDEDDDDDLPSDPAAAFGWFNNFMKFLGKFLKMEFGLEILSSLPIDPKSLPFDNIKSAAEFRALVIDKERFKTYLDDEFNPQMRNLSKSMKPWLPAEKLIQEMKECTYMKHGSASDKDVQYDKETGGTMVYYKVTCMLVKDSYYIGLSTYDNKFTLPDIERTNTTTKTEWSFLGESLHKTEVTNKWFEKSQITITELKQLHDFILRDFADRIRKEYKQYLTAAKIPVPM